MATDYSQFIPSMGGGGGGGSKSTGASASNTFGSGFELSPSMLALGAIVLVLIFGVFLLRGK